MSEQHSDINKALRGSFGTTVGDHEPDEASRKVNQWIRRERGARMLFDPNAEPDEERDDGR